MPPGKGGCRVWLVLAFPVLDVTVLALTVAAVALSGSGPERMSGWLGLGVALFVSADSRYAVGMARGGWVTGHPIDGVWVVGCAAVGLMAGSGPASQRTTARWGLASLGISLASGSAAVAVWRLAPWSGCPAGASCWRWPCIAGALARLVVAIVEVRALLESRQQALTDELTQLGNRRALCEAMDEAAAAEAPFAVLLADLDRFKEVNDRHGHAAGDELLIQIAVQLHAP